MKYSIAMTPRARRDMHAAYEFIWADSPQRADEWVETLQQAIASLAEFPARCPPAREIAADGRPVYQLLASGYRVLFLIEGDVVRVLQVRHAARRDAGPEELSR